MTEFTLRSLLLFAYSSIAELNLSWLARLDCGVLPDYLTDELLDGTLKCLPPCVGVLVPVDLLIDTILGIGDTLYGFL